MLVKGGGLWMDFVLNDLFSKMCTRVGVYLQPDNNLAGAGLPMGRQANAFG